MLKTGARFVLCCVCVLVAAHAARAQGEKLSSLLEGRVTFTLPAEWGVKKHTSTKTMASAQLDLPALDAKAAAPVVSLSANLVAEEIGVRHLSDGVYKNRFEGLAVLSDTFDGDGWRTVVWTAKSDTPFVALQRFGVVGRVAVELFVLFHLPGGGDPKPAEKRIAEFNAMCESLKVDGQNRFTNKVKLEGFAEKLKAVK